MLLFTLAVVGCAGVRPGRQAAATEIAPGVFLIPGTFVPGSQPDGNTVIFAAPRGLVVVDSGRHVRHTERILDFASSRRKPIAAVINTHWHLDHTGGNVLLRNRVPAARVYGSSAVHGALAGFLANYAVQLEDAIAKAAEGSDEQQRYRAELGLIRSGKLAPDEVIEDSGQRAVAGRPFSIRLDRNVVTAADLWLIDESTRTVVAGDLITLPVPFFDTACPQRWRDALARLVAADFQRVVPGHGPVMTRANVERYRAAYDNLLACGATESSTEACANNWIVDIGSLLNVAEHEFARRSLAYSIENFLRPGAETAHLCGN